MPARFVMFMALLTGSCAGTDNIYVKISQTLGNSLGDGGSGRNSGNRYVDRGSVGNSVNSFGDGSSGGYSGNNFAVGGPGVGVTLVPPVPNLCVLMFGYCQTPRSPCLGMIIDNPPLDMKYCEEVYPEPVCCAPSGQVFKADIENSLSYAIRLLQPNLQATTTQTSFSSITCTAFKNFISIIRKYLNTPQHIQGHTYRFIASLDSALTLPPEGIFDWRWLKNQLIIFQDWPQSNAFINGKWQPSVSCHNIKDGTCFWRYTCGLWNIFHTLTVSADNANAVEPLDVLKAIHGYVINFLGYDIGATDFGHMYNQTIGTYEDIVDKPNKAILWLWCAHNTVNQRYNSKNPRYIRRYPWEAHPQFPIKSWCFWCWGGATGDPEVTTCPELFCEGKMGSSICFQAPKDPIIRYNVFNKRIVLLYLKSTYGGRYSNLKANTAKVQLDFSPNPVCPIYES